MLAATTTPSLSAIGLAVAITVTAGVLLPLNALIFLFAMLLPIWSIGPLDPLMFDAARAAVAMLVLVKSKPTSRPLWARDSWAVAVPLSVVGTITLTVGLARPDLDAAVTGGTMLLSVFVAWVVLARVANPWTLLNGYLIGLMLSAAVMFLTAAGFSALTPQENAGYFRLTGLSPSATLITYQMALGCVIAWAAMRRGTFRVWYVTVLVASLVAVVLSGGRGGVAALGIALIVSIRWGWFRPAPAIVLGLVGWLVTSQASAIGISINTLERFKSAATGDQPDGRLTLFYDSLQSIVLNPALGQGLPEFESMYGGGPHSAILSFAVAGGLLCGLLILWVTVLLARRLVFTSPKPFAEAGKAGHLILAVLITDLIFEPTGPFVGVEFVTMLLLAVSLTSTSRWDGPAAAAPSAELTSSRSPSSGPV